MRKAARVGTSRLFLLVVALFALTTSAAVATTLFTNAYTDANGVFHGCVNSTNGNLRVVVPHEACKEREVAIEWNQTGQPGPQGIQGPKGDKGDTGATGPQGPPAASGHEVVSSVFTLSAVPDNLPVHGIGRSVQCPAGKVATGGGYDGTVFGDVTASLPLSNNGWIAGVRRHPGDGETTLAVFVVCVNAT